MKELLLVLAAGVLLGADDAKPDAKTERDKLQGDWAFVSGERDGEAIPEDFGKSMKRTFKGDTFAVSRDGEVLIKGTFTLDPTKKPKTVDLKLEGGDGTLPGIYELDGDSFKICYASPGGERPREFTTKSGGGQTLAVYKRAKK